MTEKSKCAFSFYGIDDDDGMVNDENENDINGDNDMNDDNHDMNDYNDECHRLHFIVQPRMGRQKS